MPMPVVTVASGGMAVVDVSATKPLLGFPVKEASNGFGRAVTKVTGTTPGLPVTYYAGSVELMDFTPPTITAGNVVFLAENLVLAHPLTADETVTWSLISKPPYYDADNARFEISGSTLRWLGNGTKDYELPDDFDANNTYICYVRATDTSSNTSDMMITVAVTNVADPT